MGRIEGTIGILVGTQWQIFIPQQSTAASSYEYQGVGTDCFQFLNQYSGCQGSGLRRILAAAGGE